MERTTLRIIQISSQADWQKYTDQFLIAMQKNDLTPKTLAAYRHDLSLFIKWLIVINPTRQLQSLTEIDIIEYRQCQISSGLKVATINRRIGSIQRLCRWALGSKLLKYDISKSVKQVNVVTKRCPSGLKASEVQLLLQAAGQSKHGHAKRNYALLHLMLQTGITCQ